MRDYLIRICGLNPGRSLKLNNAMLVLWALPVFCPMTGVIIQLIDRRLIRTEIISWFIIIPQGMIFVGVICYYQILPRFEKKNKDKEVE